MSPFSYRLGQHPDTGWHTVRLSYSEGGQERTAAVFTPDLGCNLLALAVDGTEYLYDYNREVRPPSILGTPVLYPTPNRVRNAQFTFGGRTFTFPANNSGNFLHGLVRGIPWGCEEPVVSADKITVTARISMAPGTATYERFPIRNTLELTYTLTPNKLRLDFVIRNEDERAQFPFGLAIHPYFRIIGPRESVRLLVPAQKWMEATNLLPSGKLVDLALGPADLRQPTPLSQLNLDDVFWGLRESQPQVIYYDQLGKKVTLTACDWFSHSVVYTPPGRPFFCVENQSCSTDAHNLYAQGLQEAAHLTILDPGASLAAWIEIAVSAA